MAKGTTKTIQPKAWYDFELEQVFLMFYISSMLVLPYVIHAVTGQIYIALCLLVWVALAPGVKKFTSQERFLHITRINIPLGYVQALFVKLRIMSTETATKVFSNRHIPLTPMLHIKIGFEPATLKKMVNISMVIFTLLIVPLVLLILFLQGLVTYKQIQVLAPELLPLAEQVIAAAKAAAPNLIPDGVDLDKGLEDVQAVILEQGTQDLKDFLRVVAITVSKIAGIIAYDYIKLIIAAIIIGSAFTNGDEYIAMHRRIISKGIMDPARRYNVLRYGELYQEKAYKFVGGWAKISWELIERLFIIMLFLPLGMNIVAIVVTAIVLGFLTSIFKIGGIIATVLAAVIMALQLDMGFGWFFAPDLVSTGVLQYDLLIKAIILGVTTKLLGVYESYHLTPVIIAKELHLPKLLIIMLVIGFALKLGAAGILIAILLLVAYPSFEDLIKEKEDGTAKSRIDAAIAKKVTDFRDAMDTTEIVEPVFQTQNKTVA